MPPRRKNAEPPEGGWIAPGPGLNQASKEFMEGTHDQTPEEYAAEILINQGGTAPKTWAKTFSRRLAKLKKKEG